MNTRQRLPFSFPELWYSLLEFNSRKICQHLTNWRRSWNKRDKVWSRANWFTFKWRLRGRRRRCCLSSLSTNGRLCQKDQSKQEPLPVNCFLSGNQNWNNNSSINPVSSPVVSKLSLLINYHRTREALRLCAGRRWEGERRGDSPFSLLPSRHPLRERARFHLPRQILIMRDDWGWARHKPQEIKITTTKTGHHLMLSLLSLLSLLSVLYLLSLSAKMSKISDEKEKRENLLFKNGPARTIITSLSVVSAPSQVYTSFVCSP